MASTGAVTPAFVSRAPRLGFVGGFDGVRGIGILMVLFNHAYSDLSPSFAGIIDVFFVMSAFLITTLLLQEHRDSDTISDAQVLLATRAVRLLPSAYLCIVAWFVVTILFARDRLSTLVGEAAAAVTYLYQIFYPVGLGAIDPAGVAEPVDRPVLVARGGGAVLPADRGHGAGVHPQAVDGAAGHRSCAARHVDRLAAMDRRPGPGARSPRIRRTRTRRSAGSACCGCPVRTR